jgi:hypothetical protein
MFWFTRFVMPLGFEIEEESSMFGAEEVPFPKPRRLRLWDQSRDLTVFPSGPLKGANQKKDGVRGVLPAGVNAWA